ncbi:MAG: DNA repair protein RadC [Methanosarcinales archaeon]
MKKNNLQSIKLRDSITILDLPPNERPRERLAKVGEKNLSNAELLAIILKTGSKGNTAIDLATNLLSKYNGDMKQLFSADIQELSKIKGIGLAKAAQIKACFELARRMFEKQKHIQEVISLLMPELRNKKQEKVIAVILDERNKIRSYKTISIGGIDINFFKLIEVFKIAIKENSNSIIIVHNHPSGDPEPSEDDIKTTKKLIYAGERIGISVQDHIIIGDGRYISMKEEGII